MFCNPKAIFIRNLKNPLLWSEPTKPSSGSWTCLERIQKAWNSLNVNMLFQMNKCLFHSSVNFSWREMESKVPEGSI
jgi:hypothetical protein